MEKVSESGYEAARESLESTVVDEVEEDAFLTPQTGKAHRAPRQLSASEELRRRCWGALALNLCFLSVLVLWMWVSSIHPDVKPNADLRRASSWCK